MKKRAKRPDDENPALYDAAKRTCHEFGMPWTDPRTGVTYPPPKGANRLLTGGQYFGRTASGALEPLGNEVSGEPDAWICRRVADYPGERIPAGGAVGVCVDCDAPIVFNPKRDVAAPKKCMQCCSIQPLPFD
jgi:hypothetical protein